MKHKIMTAVVALGVLGGGAAWLSQPASPSDMGFSVIPAAHAQETAADETGSAKAPAITEMVLGNPDAKVEVIEYASYTCSHCANFHNGPLKQIKENYVDTDKIRFVYREVYFDKVGMWASLMARCGGEAKFHGITDMLYKTQGEWLRAGSEAKIADELRKIGRLAGIESDALDACMSDADQLRALVEWFRANAEEHGIKSTPSFVINGQKYSNMSYADFAAVLDEKLAE
ncbi:MAG: DsbA family protein [Pelagimonas sp.]|jgi:protein-disulfide isomerase|nr:DsbA family protein [Pelagimonas sp.]